MKLFVEGGGDSNALRTACREGFTTFITRAGLTRRPRVVACGSRRDAFESFRTEVAQGGQAMLLVDSEAPVSADCQQSPADPTTWMPWAHLRRQPGDGWEKPHGSADTDCHLMIQCMENWFLADRAVLRTFFNPGFRSSDLPPTANSLESIAKSDVYDALRLATRQCKTKAAYGKGPHSFRLLAAIDPASVIAASPWAKRFVDCLKAKLDA